MRNSFLLCCLLFSASCSGLVANNNQRVELELGAECEEDEECRGDLICEDRVCSTPTEDGAV